MAQSEAPSTAEANSFDDSRGQTLGFAGLTRHSDITKADLPAVLDHTSSMAWWAADYTQSDLSLSPRVDDDVDGRVTADDLPERGFSAVIRELPRVSETTAGWVDPLEDEVHETDKHTALVDPDRLRAMHNGADLEADDCLAFIPTSEYTTIPPAQALNPLAEFLREQGLHDKVFGEARVADDIGAGASMDLLMDGKHVEAGFFDSDREPVVAGLEIEWDHLGDRSFRARGVLLDTRCMNAMRGVTDWEVIKHAGDLDRVEWYDWWADVWNGVDEKLDPLSDVLEAAASQTLDISAFPQDFVEVADEATQQPIADRLTAFFHYAGFPVYLAAEAAANVQRNAADPFEPSYWTLNRGATYAITHHGRGSVRGGGSIDDYHRLADDILHNPTVIRDAVEGTYERTKETLAESEDGTQTTVTGSATGSQAGTAHVRAAFGGVEKMKEQYEERREEIRQLVEADQ